MGLKEEEDLEKCRQIMIAWDRIIMEMLNFKPLDFSSHDNSNKSLDIA